MNPDRSREIDATARDDAGAFASGEGHLSDIDKPPVHPHAPTMSWGVYDFNTGSADSYPAVGARFTSFPGHRYLVTLQVQDVGIQRITLDGSGRFEAATKPDKELHSHYSPEALEASIPHQEFNNHGTAPKRQNLTVVMQPDIGAWVYNELSCGFHSWHGERLEFFAAEGVMTFTGTSMNIIGGEGTATLETV